MSPVCSTYLRKVRHRLDTQTLEDETKSLYGHRVVLRERHVLEDPHQGVDSNGGVEIIQTSTTTHGDQQLTGCVTSACRNIGNTLLVPQLTGCVTSACRNIGNTILVPQLTGCVTSACRNIGNTILVPQLTGCVTSACRNIGNTILVPQLTGCVTSACRNIGNIVPTIVAH